MFKNIIFCILIFSFIIMGCATGPQLSPMQIRQITTKLINGSYDDTYRATLTVLQDQGYIIKNTDMESGLIVANVDRASSTGSQVTQAILLGYVSDKGTEVEVSCMVNKLSNTNTEIRLNIQETNYGQSSIWSGTSKQKVKQIYEPELYSKIFNEIEVEVKRRQAMNSMANQNVAPSSRGAVMPMETKDINYDSYLESLTNGSVDKFFEIIKIVKTYCLIKVNNPADFQLGDICIIVRGEYSSYNEIGIAKIIRIKGRRIALQITNSKKRIQIGDKIKFK